MDFDNECCYTLKERALIDPLASAIYAQAAKNLLNTVYGAPCSKTLKEEIKMQTYIKGDIVLLKHLYPREEDDLRGTDIEKLYKQKRGKLGLIVQTGLNYIDIVFDSDKFISRIPYRYIQRVYRNLDAKCRLGIAPGDVIKLNEFAVTVDYITIRPVYFYDILACYKIAVFFNDGTANDILSIPFTQVTNGPRETETYRDRPSIEDAFGIDAKDLLNSYYGIGIDLANNKKQGECVCSKQNHMSYGLRAAGLYIDEFNASKEDIKKYIEMNAKKTDFYIDVFGTSKEDTKMNTKKAVETNPAYYPIKNVIFNPPATIVFWKDGSKTVVKAQGETFDPEKGLAMAISRHYLCDICNLTRFDGVFKKYLTKETKEK